MSEFRIFCIVVFVTSGLVTAAINHGIIPDAKDGAAGILMLGLMVGFAAVALFGKRGVAA